MLLDFSMEIVIEEIISSEEELVIACDQNKDRIVIYDLKNYKDGDSIDNYEVWDYSPKDSSYHLPSGVKYRENTVLGNVILTVASGGYAGIVTYPEKNLLWSTSDCGDNPHSIEILPDGNIVCAASHGSSVRLYYTWDLQYGSYVFSDEYIEYSLEDAHGVLWDPEYDVLWAVGGYELVSYKMQGFGMDATLIEIGRYSLPTYWGHDLSADMTDTNYLWISTGESIYRFNKTTGEFDAEFDAYEILNKQDIKGFGNNRNGNYFYVLPNGGLTEKTKEFSTWNSDRIYYCRKDDSGNLILNELQSESCEFYKVRVFYGSYQ